MKDLFKSKKFLVALAGVVAITVAHLTGIGVEPIEKVLYIVIAYILGQGVADIGKAK